MAVGAVWLHGQKFPDPAQRLLPATSAGTPTISNVTVTPPIIVAGTSTLVTITAQITDPTIISGSVNLVRVNSNGTSAILGAAHDDGQNGDTLAGDNTYTIQLPFNETTSSIIQLQVSAAFRGLLKRIISPVQLEVWESLADPVSGFRVLYPPGLYNVTGTTRPPSVFSLDTAPQGVNLGGTGSSPTLSSSGFDISIYPSPTFLTHFDINSWLSTTYPSSHLGTTTAITIGGQPAYRLQFTDEVGSGKPLAVVYYNGYVYTISYTSTFEPDSVSDEAGLGIFDSILHNFVFTR
jgi:hypothetical protein